MTSVTAVIWSGQFVSCVSTTASIIVHTRITRLTLVVATATLQPPYRLQGFFGTPRHVEVVVVRAAVGFGILLAYSESAAASRVVGFGG